MRKLRGWLGRAGPVLLALAGVVVVVAAVFILPARLARPPKGPITPAERLKAENDVRTTLIQGLGGAALLSGVYFTARTLKINREGQITERFTRAIDQLGNNSNLSVCLGGIYALERIARDSGRDHWPIMEVLTTYLREHTKSIDAGLRPDILPADIQAVATVLARRPEERRREEHRPLNLIGAHLEEATLEGAHLEGALLRGARLEGVDLSGAHLERANLLGAHLERANLLGAHLEGADLGAAHLERADLGAAHLERADLGAAHLEGAYLRGATGLINVQLEEAYTDEKTVLPGTSDEP